MESLSLEPHCAPGSEVNTMVPQPVPTSSQELEPPSTTITKEDNGLSCETTPCIPSAAVNANVDVEATNTEYSKPVTSTANEIALICANDSSRAGERGHINADGNDDIDVDEDRDDDEAGSSEVSDDDDLKVFMDLRLPVIRLLPLIRKTWSARLKGTLTSKGIITMARSLQMPPIPVSISMAWVP
jgi:hypothetical protein